MTNDYREKFKKLIKEEEEKRRREEESEKERLRVVKEFHSQIKEVCKSFVRSKGKNWEYGGRHDHEGYYHMIEKESHTGYESEISVAVGPKMIAVYSRSSGIRSPGVSIPLEEFSKSWLADAIIKVYKDEDR